MRNDEASGACVYQAAPLTSPVQLATWAVQRGHSLAWRPAWRRESEPGLEVGRGEVILLPFVGGDALVIGKAVVAAEKEDS